MSKKPTFKREQELSPIADSDIDSLFILPLSIIPIQTPALQTARLIKNVRLQSIVEVFQDIQTGSGQVEVESLPRMFEWPEDSDEVHPDLSILRRLALLPSYDVYSLRISLRQHGIAINDFAALRLSPEKAAELTKYMMNFTRPLIQKVYGNEQVEVNSYDDLIRLFRDPDIKKARERLEAMARSLNIDVWDVPRFIEDYGDTFMSLSYFRYCLDRLTPYMEACTEALNPIRDHFQLKQDMNLMKTCDLIEETINSLASAISGRLEVFDRRTKEMWNDISQEQYREVKALIEKYYISIGASLCSLTVKMNAFARMFPRPSVGGPVKRADFMMTEMAQGIEMIRANERRFSSM